LGKGVILWAPGSSTLIARKCDKNAAIVCLDSPSGLNFRPSRSLLIWTSPRLTMSEAISTNQSPRSSHTGVSIERHLWICSSSFFESVLFLHSRSGNPFTLHLYDADGELINKLSLNFPASQIGAIEVCDLLEGCKLESGLKHGHAVISGSEKDLVACRIQSREHGAMLPICHEFRLDQALFYPITVCDERSYILPLTNFGKAPMQVRCRLFLGKRTPEVMVTLPPLASRIISISSDFAEFLEPFAGKQTQCYVRLTSKDSAPIGAQLIERCQLSNARFAYSAVN